MGMRKKTLIFFVVLMSVLWTAGAWAQLKDGLWEITTQVEMKGMPQKMPPATVRQCITKSDPVPKSQDKKFECKVIDQKISGDTVNYSVECKGKDGVMQTSGKHTYTGSSMEGSSTTNFKMKGQPEMQMASKIKGKYIGPCPK
jgi:hypothetical protein